MGRYREAARRAADLTNKELAQQMATFSRFRQDELQTLLPRKSDKEAFLELMAQVEAETDVDRQLSYLRDNLQSAGKAVLQVLRYFL